MAIRGIDPNNFAYYPPNYSEDIRKDKGYIFLGSSQEPITIENWRQKWIRELIIKANFEAKKNLCALGEFVALKKIPSQWYHWQVIKVTIQTLCLQLLRGIPGIILVGTPFINAYMGNKLTTITTYIFVVMLFFSGTFYLVHLFGTYFKILQEAQDPYLDSHVAFHEFSKIPNSMEGFDPDQLANVKSAEGWVDPITLDTIPADKISSTEILRFGTYAIPIQTALESMLTRMINESPRGEIPHPIEQRMLSLEEKEKFLREAAAFFAIMNPQALEACWNVRVSSRAVDSVTSQLNYWDVISPIEQTTVYHEIVRQVLPIERKQAFLKLLPDTIAKTYFDENFRSTSFRVPEIQMPTDQEARILILQSLLSLIVLVAARVYELQQRRPT